MTYRSYLSASSYGSERGLNFKNRRTRDLYSKWIRGDATKDDFMDPVTLQRESDVTILTASIDNNPPSWTQIEANLKHSAVLMAHSASEYETRAFNAYNSGSIALEQTAIPASASEYYSKSDRFFHVVYKLTGSDLLVDPAFAGTDFHDATKGTYFALGQGSYTGGNPNYAIEHLTASNKIVEIDIPDYGKIRDIRVWLEVVTGPVSSNIDLWTIALRSPNVNFFSGIPHLNDPIIKSRFEPVGTNPITGSLRSAWMNSYILWNGVMVYPNEWNTKKHGIRTIFSDSSNQFNPADYSIRFAATGQDDFDEIKRVQGSPDWKWVGEDINGTNFPAGIGIPWYGDPDILTASDPTAGGSPPKGWLTGPAETADENEWPTTGSNYGPATIRPAYPLLDDIVETRQNLTASINIDKFSGFRQGLRGTEIHGRWQLIFAHQSTDVGLGIYFRQLRLEFICEKNYHADDIPKNRKWRFNSNNSFNGKKRKLLSRVSGSRTDLFEACIDGNKPLLNEVYEANGFNDYGLTIGITDNTGSSQDYAVFSRITGSLATKLSGSKKEWFLDNEFGTPYIPISSGSGEDPSFNVFTDVASNNQKIADTLNPKTLISTAQTLRAALSTFDTTKETRDILAEKTSGSL